MSGIQRKLSVMKENFKVGEKVRLLHAKGEGIVLRLISPTKLEVLIDDFYEMEVAIGEVVKINAAESILRREGEEEDAPKKHKGVGPTLAPAPDLPASFVLYKNQDLDYEFWLVNQGRNELLFTMFIKVGNKFTSYNSGNVLPRENHFLGKQTPADFHMARTLYLQVLQFPRIEHPKPIPPLTFEINVKTDIFIKAPIRIPELNVEGWEFILEEKPVDVETRNDSDTEVRFVSQKPPKPPKVVDLHLNKIVSNTLGIDSHTMLRLQLEHFEKAITDAQAHRIDSMVFIHGIGNGTLKKEIHNRLMAFAFVKEYRLAEPMEYGNGATIVFFE
jgi:hypothetical protein